MNLPTYSQLILPALRAVDALDGSANPQEIITCLVEGIDPTEAMMSILFPGRPEESVVLSRVQWAGVAVQVRDNRRK